MKLTLRLTLDVTYDTHNSPHGGEDVRALLARLPAHALGEGLLTGETPCTVEHWTMAIKVLNPARARPAGR